MGLGVVGFVVDLSVGAGSDGAIVPAGDGLEVETSTVDSTILDPIAGETFIVFCEQPDTKNRKIKSIMGNTKSVLDFKISTLNPI